MSPVGKLVRKAALKTLVKWTNSCNKRSKHPIMCVTFLNFKVIYFGQTCFFSVPDQCGAKNKDFN